MVFRLLNDSYLVVLKIILVLRGGAPFARHQESRPLGRSNIWIPRLTDCPLLCASSESSLTNLNSWECKANSLPVRTLKKSDPAKGRESLVLTNRSAASGDENGWQKKLTAWQNGCGPPTLCWRLNVRLHSRTILYTPSSRFPEFTTVRFSPIYHNLFSK